MNIIRVVPDWYEEFDNAASFKILMNDEPPEDSWRYEEKDGIFVANVGDRVRMFAYKKPGQGYGGRRFNITMKDGSEKELIGPWSSNAESVSSFFPGLCCTSCSLTCDEEVMNRGHTFTAGHVLIGSLVAWYIAQRSNLDWSLYFMSDGSLQPAKGRFVKNGGPYIARLFPAKIDIAKQYAQQHYQYFMDKVSGFWSKSKPEYDECSSQQRRAIRA